MIPALDRLSFYAPARPVDRVDGVPARPNRVDRVEPIEPGPYEEASAVTLEISPQALEKSRAFSAGEDGFARDSDGSAKQAARQLLAPPAVVSRILDRLEPTSGQPLTASQALTEPGRPTSQTDLRRAFSAGKPQTTAGVQLNLWA